jgi:hypothetical protein
VRGVGDNTESIRTPLVALSSCLALLQKVVVCADEHLDKAGLRSRFISRLEHLCPPSRAPHFQTSTLPMFSSLRAFLFIWHLYTTRRFRRRKVSRLKDTDDGDAGESPRLSRPCWSLVSGSSCCWDAFLRVPEESFGVVYSAAVACGVEI